ncbi:MAG: SDR family NAD(P)-dependent oxidoreductase [Rhodospirillaceae bacterium]|nr:SDR family NAD(P)-dependent oxidoreductase [Rhodospirillaceae bacterium]
MQRRDMLSTLAVGTFAAAPAAAQPIPPSAENAPFTDARKAAQAKDAVVLVTGANRGVGLGFVKVALARGARRVYATGRNPKNLPDVVALDPDRVVPLTLDVTDDAQRRAAAEAAQDATWLINNAAYPGSEQAEERRVRSAATLDDLKRTMDTNCWAPAELARLFAPIIIKNGGGVIAQVLSGGAWFCLPEFSGYSISKAAAAIMTAGLRAELDRDPVLVARVYTGGVQTRAAPVGYTGGVTPEQHAEEVFDALAKGEADVFPAGSRRMAERIRTDPAGFERGVIDRFHTNPVRIAPYE